VKEGDNEVNKDIKEEEGTSKERRQNSSFEDGEEEIIKKPRCCTKEERGVLVFKEKHESIILKYQRVGEQR
jgi:hypothetical protein